MAVDTFFNVNQVAYILKVHPLTVRRYLKEGKLKAVKVAGNIRIKESELQEFHNRDFTPKKAPLSPFPKFRKISFKIFTVDDPLFRMQGRGASLHITKP